MKKKLKVGDKVVAVKDSLEGWYKAGDVFIVVNVLEEMYCLYIRHPSGSVLAVPFLNFRPFRPIKPLPTIKIRGTDNFCLTIAPSKDLAERKAET